MTLGRYDRRSFLALAGSAAAAVVAAACGDDGERDGSGTSAAGVTPLAAASPTVTVGTDLGAVTLRWFGQSMFLLTSPGGTTVLLDPFNDIGYTVPPPLDADVATITHEHPDHNNDALGGTTARLLRGLTADGWAEIDESAGDVRIRTVPTYHDAMLGSERGRNATFLFETGGLRIAHFGDLGHRLQNVQLAALGGDVDVAMVPVGGVFTIDAAAATEVVAQVKAKIVFPMHYKTDKIALPLATVDGFLVGKTVQRAGSSTTRLAKAELPAETTTMVLDYE